MSNGNGSEDTTFEYEPNGAVSKDRMLVILTETCGRGLVGYVPIDPAGPVWDAVSQYGARWITMTDPMELRVGMMTDQHGRPAFGSELRPLINTDWTPEINCQVSDWRAAGPGMEVSYLRDLRGYREKYEQGERARAQSESRVHQAAVVPPEEIAAAAALARMRAGGRA